ncbi:hypothetical protein [Cetobacterium sp. SF1]|uniref:hypothetical protein n=1 Tax=Cetobacterium sp. SF1 TaxID=3417654 RepID=UPI003CE8BC6C
MLDNLFKKGFSALKDKAAKVKVVQEELEALDSETLIRKYRLGDFSDKNMAISIILKDRNYNLVKGHWEKE